MKPSALLNNGRTVGVHQDRETSAGTGPGLQVADSRVPVPQDPNALGKALLFVDDFKPFLTGIHVANATQRCERGRIRQSSLVASRALAVAPSDVPERPGEGFSRGCIMLPLAPAHGSAVWETGGSLWPDGVFGSAPLSFGAANESVVLKQQVHSFGSGPSAINGSKARESTPPGCSSANGSPIPRRANQRSDRYCSPGSMEALYEFIAAYRYEYPRRILDQTG